VYLILYFVPEPLEGEAVRLDFLVVQGGAEHLVEVSVEAMVCGLVEYVMDVVVDALPLNRSPGLVSAATLETNQIQELTRENLQHLLERVLEDIVEMALGGSVERSPEDTVEIIWGDLVERVLEEIKKLEGCVRLTP